MAYYDTFIKSLQEPSEKWRDGFQELVNRTFDNASTFQEDVEEEIAFGTLEFKPIICRVNSLVDAKTGQRVNDDYKKLIFKDNNYQPPLGTRYRFYENIWIVYSTDNIKVDTAAVYVRRCNNTMNTQDKYGNIHREPCYIDYKVTENQIFKEYSIDVPSGRIQVQCQRNKWTRNIDVGVRFIFGHTCYRVRNLADFDRRYTFDNESNYMFSFYADVNSRAESDNFELGVADYKEFNYHIETTDNITNVIGHSGIVESAIYLNGHCLVGEPIHWESTDENVAKINPTVGAFELISIGNCQFIARMTNKNDVLAYVDVGVTSSVTSTIEIKILPINILTVPLNGTNIYTVYEYVNGERTATTFNILESGLNKKHYKLETDGDEQIGSNEFKVTNLRTNRCELLKLICISRTPRTNANGDTIHMSKEIELEMGGVHICATEK